MPPPQTLRGGPSKATLMCTPDSFCIKFYASWDHQSSSQIAFNLGFGCSVSHSRKEIEVGIPGGCSSPVKRPTKASPPGVGRRRRRSGCRKRERESARRSRPRGVNRDSVESLPTCLVETWSRGERDRAHAGLRPTAVAQSGVVRSRTPGRGSRTGLLVGRSVHAFLYLSQKKRSILPHYKYLNYHCNLCFPQP